MKTILFKPLRIIVLLTGIFIFPCEIQSAGCLAGSLSKTYRQDTISATYGKPLEDRVNHSDNITSPTNPEVLKKELFEFNDTELMTYGISDPGMDSTEANELAYYRALALLALLNKCTVNNVTEAYYRDVSGKQLVTTQFNSLSRIKAAIAITPESIQKIAEAITNSDEKMIKIAFNESKAKVRDSLFVQAEVFYSETPLSIGERIYTYFKMSAFLNNPSNRNKEIFVWESHLDNGRLEFVSSLMGNKIEYPVRYRYYSAPKAYTCKSEPDPDFYQHEDMGYGFWNAYAISILRNIDLLEKEFTEIKAMTDNYGGQAEFITREISSNTVSFLIESACTANNRLYLRLKQK